MIHHINHLLWWKTCKPLKSKYHLSTNCLLVLIGCYVYCTFVKSSFTWHSIIPFVSYYNSKKTAEYLTVLVCNGYLVKEEKNNRISYYISELGIKVCKEIEDNYSLAFSRFIDKYNIKL